MAWDGMEELSASRLSIWGYDVNSSKSKRSSSGRKCREKSIRSRQRYLFERRWYQSRFSV